MSTEATVKVKVLVSLGCSVRGSLKPGDEAEYPMSEALRMKNAGIVEIIEETKQAPKETKAPVKPKAKTTKGNK